MTLKPRPTDDLQTVPIHTIENEDYHFKSFRIMSKFDKIERRQFHKKPAHIANAYPNFWAVFMYDSPQGHVITIRHERKIFKIQGKCAIFIPPMALLQWDVPAGWTEWTSYTSMHPMPLDFSTKPVVIRLSDIPIFENYDQLLSFLDPHVRVKEEAAAPLKTEPPKHHERVINYIQTHYRKDLSMAQVSAELGVPPSTMTHEFKRAYGVPPNEYLHTLRVFGILAQASNGEEMSKVAKEFGYQDYSSLYRQFVKVLGHPPSTFSRRGFAPKGTGNSVHLKFIE